MSQTTSPSSKILAIGRSPTPPSPDQLKEVMPREIPATLQMYLDGKMDQFWVIQGNTGVVFIMNTSSIDQARDWLEALPLGVAKLMVFDYTVIGPLKPLGFLIDGKLPNV